MADTPDVLLIVFHSFEGTCFVRADQIVAVTASDDGMVRSEIMLLGGAVLFATETPDEILEKLNG